MIPEYRKLFDLIGKLGDLESENYIENFIENPLILPEKIKWLRRLDSNQGMSAPKADALPLGYASA